jgi:hypothetical protein
VKAEPLWAYQLVPQRLHTRSTSVAFGLPSEGYEPTDSGTIDDPGDVIAEIARRAPTVNAAPKFEPIQSPKLGYVCQSCQ